MSRSLFLKQTSLLPLGILTNAIYESTFSIINNKGVIIGLNSHCYKVGLNCGNLDHFITPVKDSHKIIQDSKGKIVMLTNHINNNVINCG